jgi:hypothetical protein
MADSPGDDVRSLAGEGLVSPAAAAGGNAADANDAAEAARPASELALELEWVLGCSTGSGSVAAVDERRVLYISGNVGVIYDTADRTQTLLRGHVRVGSDAAVLGHSW